VIASPRVTIDLAGFSISGNGTGTGIKLVPRADIGLFENLAFAARNGTISVFEIGVDVPGFGSIIEGLRLFSNQSDGIHNVNGIIRGNTVFTNGGAGINASGTITGNYALRNGGAGIAGSGTISDNFSIGNVQVGISAFEGSTLIGNTAPSNEGIGISVNCPSNVTNNTAVNNPQGNLVLNGTGCNDTNNVAP
jgi:hypothetical protein